jgi:hypothetical protein
MASVLPDSKDDNQKQSTLTGASSIWQAMEVLKDTQHPVNVKLADGATKTITFAGLMAAYEDYQTRVKA